MKVRCGAYARYSSDRQNPASNEDQLRNCRQFAAKDNLELLPDHIYTDEELSGAGADRPGYIRMLRVISQRPRPFDVLLVDDTSRLTRNRAELERLLESLQFAGIRVVAVSQGIDTSHEQADVLLTVHSLVDSLYIKELAKKTRRGLVGRVLKGLHAGGRTFGYKNEPVPNIAGADGTPAVELKINDAERPIVKRIFEMAADGGSLKKITKTLNGEHVPPPRKRAKKRDAVWCPNAMR